MSTTIEYTYVSENDGTWTGDRSAAIARGVEALAANECEDGTYIYRASDAEGGDYYVVTADEVAELGAALLDGRSLSEAYSIWCSSAGREATAGELRDHLGVEVHTSSVDEDGEPDEYRAYVAVGVLVDGVEHRVGCMVGVPEAQEGTARAAGDETPFLDAWWADSSDWASLRSRQVAGAVLSALYDGRISMWRTVVAAREVAS